MNHSSSRRTLMESALVLFLAASWSIFFWSPIWQGKGLIGNDTYPYYFPQKQFYAEQLQQGVIPIWNPRTGHGYPLLAESQTGVFYPLNLLTYSWMTPHRAYHVLQLGHYIFAFLGGWFFARELGLGLSGAGLASLIFVYGWFPVRIGLEWAIITGAWIPWILAFTLRYQRLKEWWTGILLTCCWGTQLLAGHFNLAFATQLAWLALVLFRSGNLLRDGNLGTIIRLGFFGVLGFLLASVQLIPSWELRQESQRAEVNLEHAPGVGAIPIWYLSQVFAPWEMYDPQIDPNAGNSPETPRTNRTEAHLYFSLAGLLLCGIAILNRAKWNFSHLVLLGIALVSLLHTTGILIPMLLALPGFNFFQGPGRFGVLTTLCVAYGAGLGLDSILPKRGRTNALVATLLVYGLVGCDLWWVGYQVGRSPVMGIVFFTSNPPLERIDESPVARILRSEPGPVRLFSRGANVANLLGVSSTPVYLGIGPKGYFSSDYLSQPYPFDAPPSAEQIEWLREAGVTHVLSFQRLLPPRWPVEDLWEGEDPVLNTIWARGGQPLFLYRLKGARGRAFFENNQGTVRFVKKEPHLIEVAVENTEGGNFIMTELAYPGWTCAIDGEQVELSVHRSLYQMVDVPSGAHRVTFGYEPRSFLIGSVLSIVVLFCLATYSHFRFWHPSLFRRQPEGVRS